MYGFGYRDSSIEDLREDFGKLFETGEFADARLICFENIQFGNENGEERKPVTIPVHKAILASRSKFFAEQFADGKNELEIQDFPPKIVKIGIGYLYKESIPTDLNEGELIALYNASEHYDLGIFETDNIQLEIVIAPLPTEYEFLDQVDVTQKKRKRKVTEFKIANTFNSRIIDACSKQWRSEMGVGLREPPPEVGQPPKKLTKTQQMELTIERVQKTNKKMHMDFVLEWQNGHGQQVLISNLSLSLLNSKREKLMSVTREGFSSTAPKGVRGLQFHRHNNKINWEDCFNYYQVDKMTKTHWQSRKLIVLCEATVIVEKCYGYSMNQNKKTAYQSDFMNLFEKGQFSDACIVCYEESIDGEKAGGKKAVKIPIHKAVLAARSKFFAAAFSTAMKEAESGEIVVLPETGFSLATVKSMLSFVYSTTIPPSEELTYSALVNIYKAAHLYELQGLVNRCSELLRPVVDNCCELLSLAHIYDDNALMRKTLQFLRANRTAVKATEGWRSLMESEEPTNEKEKKSIETLKIICGYWLLELPLTQENCFEVLRVADHYGNEELKKVALTIILYDEKAIRETEEWRRLMESGKDGEWLKELIREEKRERKRADCGCNECFREYYSDYDEEENSDYDDDYNE